MAGVAGVPEGEGPRLSQRAVDDPASRPPRSRAGPAEGHACLANLAQGTVCKILDQEEVKPHKVRYYLEQSSLTGPEAGYPGDRDNGPGFCRPAELGAHATFAREHEYKRHGTVSLLAGIDKGAAQEGVDRRGRNAVVSDDRVSLIGPGISKDQSSNWQKLGAIPKEVAFRFASGSDRIPERLSLEAQCQFRTCTSRDTPVSRAASVARVLTLCGTRTFRGSGTRHS